jgi:hypothetical protein
VAPDVKVTAEAAQKFHQAHTKVAAGPMETSTTMAPPATNHLLIICQSPANHLPITCQLPANCLPIACHSPAILLPFTCHSPAKGHISNATHANKQGGNTRCCNGT